MSSQQFTLTIQSRLDSVHILAIMARKISESAGFSAHELDEVELCISEAANNAIKHAYSGESKYVVELAVTVLPDSVVYDLFDSGLSADPSMMEADRRYLLDVDPALDGLGESGRGIAIMQSVMHSLQYTAGQRNRLRLTKLLPCSAKTK